MKREWKSYHETVSGTGSPPKVNQCFPLVGSTLDIKKFDYFLNFAVILHTNRMTDTLAISISISFSIAQTLTVRPRAHYIVIISCVIQSSLPVLVCIRIL